MFIFPSQSIDNITLWLTPNKAFADTAKSALNVPVFFDKVSRIATNPLAHPSKIPFTASLAVSKAESTMLEATFKPV